jgi:MFS family permease
MIGNSKPERLWSKDYVLLMVASTGISFCNYFFFPTLPIYVHKLTGSTGYSGLMMGVYTLAALAIRPFSGMLSDKFGRTKLIIAGAFLCALACSLYGFSAALIFLICMRALHGIGFGIHTTAGGAIVGDVVPKYRMAEGIGCFGIFGTIAAAAGPGIALSIIGTGERQGFQALFILAALASLLSMVFDCFITYERKQKNAKSGIQKKDPGRGDRSLPRTLFGFEYPVFRPGLTLVLFYIALSSVVTFLPLFALERALGNIGLFFTISAFGLFASRVLLGKITDRHGPNIVVMPGIALLAICLALIPFIGSRAYLLCIAFPLGLAQGAVGPTINAIMFMQCSPQRRGTASAAYFSSIDIGYAIGSIGFGVIAAKFGYYVVYLGSMLFAVMALLLYFSGMAKQKLKLQPH